MHLRSLHAGPYKALESKNAGIWQEGCVLRVVLVKIHDRARLSDLSGNIVVAISMYPQLYQVFSTGSRLFKPPQNYVQLS